MTQGVEEIKHNAYSKYDDIFDDAGQSSKGWWPNSGEYYIKAWRIDDDKFGLAVFNKVTFAKYKLEDVQHEQFKNEVLIEMITLAKIGDKNCIVSIKQIEGAIKFNIRHSIVSIKLVTEASLEIPVIKESADQVVLFKLKQMELNQQHQIQQLHQTFDKKIEKLLKLHQSVILLPGATKIIGIHTTTLTLDGRDLGIILRKILPKKDDDVKNDDDANDAKNDDDAKKDDDVKNDNLLFSRSWRPQWSQYTNNTAINANLQSVLIPLGLKWQDINGCNSCGSLCNCNQNQYQRNKMLMVIFHSLQQLELNLEKTYPNNDKQFHNVIEQLAAVVEIITNPSIVSFNGSDISALCGLRGIVVLSIKYNDNIVDISSLGTLLTLEKLTIEHCGGVEDVCCIRGLKRLQYLSFFGCVKVYDITKLGVLKKLKVLNVKKTAVINIVVFYQYPQLSILFDK